MRYMAGGCRPFGGVPRQPALNRGIGGRMLDLLSLLPWVILGMIVFAPMFILIYLFIADLLEHRKSK